jgi:peptidoglycan/LPS O-acetylase OafA/YrhL
MDKGVRYFDEINILRAFAILAVISIHISAKFTNMSIFNFLTTVYEAVDVFSHFAVPLFICISGFVLYNKYSDKIILKKFYEKRLMSVLPQYIIFSAFYLGITYIDSIFLAKSVNLDIPHVVYLFITGRGYYHLWFFILIIQFYLLYPAILRMYRYCDSRGRSFELLFVVFLMGVFYKAYSIPDISIFGTPTAILEVVTMFIGYLFYFLLGIIVRSRYEELLLKPVSNTSLYCMSAPLLCGTIFGIFDFAQKYLHFDISQIQPLAGQYWNWLTATITPLYYVIIFALCLNISLKIVSNEGATFRLLEKIGHYSFGIYLVHAFILYVIVMVFSRFGFDWNNWLFYPLTFCLTLILSILSVVFIQKFPYSKYIVGSTR